MSTTSRVTAKELSELPDDGRRYELIEGEIREMTPSGGEHGGVAADLHCLLGSYVRQNKLGRTFIAEAGFTIAQDPDTVRAPDIGFVRKENLPAGPLPKGFFPAAPDLAVEVLSPNDKVSQVDEKVQAWLDAGTAMVWVVNPTGRNVTVYRSPKDVRVLTEDDPLDGEDVVSGFQCGVAELFSGGE